MATTLLHTALVTDALVKGRSFGTLGKSIQAALAAGSGNDWEAIVDVIHDLSGRIDDILNRGGIMVRQRTIRFRPYAFKARPKYREGTTRDETLLLAPTHEAYPVVEVISVDGNTASAWTGEVKVFNLDGMTLVGYNPITAVKIVTPPKEMIAYVGYRRGEMIDVASVDTSMGTPTPTITVLPSVVPSTVTRAALRAVIGELREATKGLVGVSSSSTRADAITVQSERADTAFWDDIANSLIRHTYIPT